jgi:hypothetical protein
LDPVPEDENPILSLTAALKTIINGYDFSLIFVLIFSKKKP